MYKKYIGVVLGIFVVTIACEAIWAWKKRKSVYNAKETASNIFILLVGQSIKPLTLAWQVGVIAWASQFSIWKLPTNATTILIAIVLVDLLYYWHHRALHEIKLLWTIHNVHHSSPWMNLTTSFRLNWLGPLFSPIFYIPAALLGFSIKSILAFFLLNLFFQFFLHTESINKLGRLEGWLNTPSSHRVHHGSNPLYIDKNYGGVFMVWDRLFGTYQEETEQVHYGITTGFLGHNPFVLVFGPLIEFFKGKYTRERENIPAPQKPQVTEPAPPNPTYNPSTT